MFRVQLAYKVQPAQLAFREQRVWVLMELQAQPASLGPPAYKALQVLVLPAQRGCKAQLVLTERQAQLVLA